MTEGPITTHDLHWWLEFAAARHWTFAKTYTTTAPHHYVVQDRTPEVTHDDMVRAARVIHTFGSPGKYYSVTKIYLVSPDGRYRWWTEDDHFTDTTLVNRATTDRSYGIQNAPSTITGDSSPYDGIATYWDAQHPIADGAPQSVKDQLSAVRGQFPPQVLDIGCGTGRVLDLGLVHPDRYAGLDSSQAMLNMLVRKHPRVAAIYPVSLDDALAGNMFTLGQFDWVFLDRSIRLTAEQHISVESLARRAIVTTGGDEWRVRDVTDAATSRIRAEAVELAPFH